MLLAVNAPQGPQRRPHSSFKEQMYQLFRNKKKKRKLDMQHTNFILTASQNEMEEINVWYLSHRPTESTLIYRVVFQNKTLSQKCSWGQTDLKIRKEEYRVLAFLVIFWWIRDIDAVGKRNTRNIKCKCGRKCA